MRNSLRSLVFNILNFHFFELDTEIKIPDRKVINYHNIGSQMIDSEGFQTQCPWIILANGFGQVSDR